MPFKIIRNDITKMETEAIVNTASSDCSVGAGCDMAIYNAAGFEELSDYRIRNVGEVSEGNAFITPAFALKAKNIIHVVSPLYKDGESGEDDKLRSCYRNALKLANENGIRSISFPLVSTGNFGYPREEGIRIALDEINRFLINNEMEVYLVVFDEKSTELGERVYPDLQSYIDHHYVEKRQKEEYAAAYSTPVRPGDIAYPEYGRRYDKSEERLSRKPRTDKASKPQVLSSKPSAKPLFSVFKSAKKEQIELNCDEMVQAPVMQAPMMLANTDSIDGDFMPRDSKLDERMKHLKDTFSQYLLYIIQEKGLTNVEVYRRSILCDKKTFSKIKNNINYHPDKRIALCLCVGARLNLDEAVDLLARAGYALSPCDKQDIIFSYFLEKSPDEYDMIDVDIELEKYELPCIIA